MPQGANSKKRYTYIWVSLIILIIGVIVVPRIVDRIQGESVVVNNRMANTMGEQKLTYIINNGKRRKVPQFSLMNQDSVLISDQDLMGNVYVVDFFFTSCPTICPLMTKNLIEIQQTFEQRDDFALVSLTIDPKRDTPERLQEYAASYGAYTDNWHFLTGPRDEIYKLANEGFYMYANENESVAGGFEHSGLFALVDKNGFLRSRMDAHGNPIIFYRGTISEAQGINEDGEVQQITNLKEDIQKLLEE